MAFEPYDRIVLELPHPVSQNPRAFPVCIDFIEQHLEAASEHARGAKP